MPVVQVKNWLFQREYELTDLKNVNNWNWAMPSAS